MPSIQYYQTGDDDNTILRKFLENQAQVIAGNLSYATTGGGGTPGGSSGDLQYNDAGSFGGYTPGAGVVAWLQDPTFAKLNTALTGDDVAGLAANNSFTGVNTFAGSTIRTPATITITANAGPWDITKGLSLATNNAATTITPSAAGTTGQLALVNLINSDGSNARVFTFDTGTDFGITAAAGKTTTVSLYSDGTGWLPFGGSPSLLDAAADTAPASTKLIGTWDATSGVQGKSTIAQVLAIIPNGSVATTQSAGSNDTKVATDAYADTAALATHLGTFASPNTAAGSITWTSPVYNIYTSAGSTRTYTLPAASTYVNRAFILNVAVGTGHVNVQPASGAALVLAGVLLTADHYVQAATSAPGNYICFISDGTNWTSLGSSGTWADAASP